MRQCFKIKLIAFSKFIYKILKKLEVVFDNHKYISSANILSILLGFLPFCYCFMVFKLENKVDGIDFLVPIPFVYLISHFSVSISEKHPRWSRIISIFIVGMIIVGIQLIGGTMQLKTDIHNNYTYPHREYRYYENTVSQMRQGRVGHFPRKVPMEATNVAMKLDCTSFFGSECLYLKFNTDKEYIDSELKKHNYINIIRYKDLKSGTYSFYFDDVDLNDYTLYVINDRDHEKPPEHCHPYHFGIGVNSDKTEILYYYENPD